MIIPNVLSHFHMADLHFVKTDWQIYGARQAPRCSGSAHLHWVMVEGFPPPNLGIPLMEPKTWYQFRFGFGAKADPHDSLKKKEGVPQTGGGSFLKKRARTLLCMYVKLPQSSGEPTVA